MLSFDKMAMWLYNHHKEQGIKAFSKSVSVLATCEQKVLTSGQSQKPAYCF